MDILLTQKFIYVITHLRDYLVGGTTNVGEFKLLTFTRELNKDTDYFLCLAGGTDIATNLPNKFMMTVPWSNENNFMMTYITSLQSYYIRYQGLNYFESENKVKSIFGLSSWERFCFKL